jgi:hypothetical protein
VLGVAIGSGSLPEKILGHDPSSGRDPKFLPVATQARVVTQPVATRNFFESCRIELVISFSHDFRVFSLWVATQSEKKIRVATRVPVTTPEKSGSRPDLGRDRESGRPTPSITPNTSVNRMFDKKPNIRYNRQNC